MSKIVPPKRDDVIDVDALVVISQNLDAEFRQQAGLYAWVAYQLAQAKQATRLRKAELELVEAKLFYSGRKQLQADGTKVTERALDAFKTSRAAFQMAKKALNEAIYREDLLAGVVRALEHKREALYNLAAGYRQSVEMRMTDSNKFPRR